MKKLKQMSGPYSIGFELSSTAHGFVATDPNGNVLYHGKQPVMGTRVFKEGQHAAEARMPRTSRRGIQRRRGREHEMERVFAPVISPIDPDFFIRRRMSYKLGKIRFESDPIGFSYSCLFHSFPTLAHLDVALMESDSAMDPRLIFEAVANHVVRRGHFLLENQNVSSTNSDIDTQVANYAEVLVFYFEDTLDERIELSLEALDINGNVTARELQKQFASAMCVSGDDIQKKTEKAQIKAIADLVAGYKADLTVLVPDAEKLPKVSISDGDALEEFLADSCPDSLVPVLMAAQALYTSWKLQGMLSYAPGKSLSHNQVAQHDVYGKQLRMLKDLALKYVAKQDANGNVDEEDCRKAFLSSRTGRLGAFGKAFHSFIEAPSGDLVSAYILAIDSEDERKADVLLRFYTAPGERAVLLYRDTIAFVSETMPETGDTVTVKSSRELSKDVMLNHRFQIG